MLTLIRELEERDKFSHKVGLYKCHCGKEVKVTKRHVETGNTTSCGCYKQEYLEKVITKHGKHNSSEYQVWTNIKQRCSNEKTPNYKDYGGRGIIVCDRWKESFENFYEDMGEKPNKKLTIERRDNNRNYCPDNCYWGTRKEQYRNRRSNVYITFDGKTQTLIDWSAELDIIYETLKYRLRKGMSVEEAFTTPVKKRNNVRTSKVSG